MPSTQAHASLYAQIWASLNYIGEFFLFCWRTYTAVNEFAFSIWMTEQCNTFEYSLWFSEFGSDACGKKCYTPNCIN